MNKKLYPMNLIHAIRAKESEEIGECFTEDNAAGLRYAISVLEKEEQEIIRLGYEEGKNHEEIREILQYSVERIILLENKAIKKLRKQELYNYIKYGIEGYVQKILTEEYMKAYESGYDAAMEDAKKGFSRTQKDISIMNLPLEALQLDTRSYNCLYYYGCRTVGDCIKMEEEQIKRMRNLGPVCIEAIGRALQRKKIYHTDWDKFLKKQK